MDYARTDEELQAKMSLKALAGYDGVVFASTTGELPLPDRQGFVDWVAAGHAFVGIHSATDTYHEWPPFIQMIGGEFKTHGPQVKVALLVQDPNHPATRGMASPLEVFDEIYQYKSFERERVQTLHRPRQAPQRGNARLLPAGLDPRARQGPRVLHRPRPPRGRAGGGVVPQAPAGRDALGPGPRELTRRPKDLAMSLRPVA